MLLNVQKGALQTQCRQLSRAGPKTTRFSSIISRAVASSPLESGPVAMQKHGFGFSAGGLLFPYYVGVAWTLKELGVLKDETPVAGSSAGSLVAATIKSGLTLDQTIDATLVMAYELRNGGTRHRLGPVLQSTLERMLPDDIGERMTGVAHIGVTKIFPTPSSVLINTFTSKKDAIDTLLTSCHIPWYFTGSLTTQYRGALHTDGGLTNFLPNTPGVEKPVRVCCFPSKQLRSISDIDISPDSFEDWPMSLNQMLPWAFEPAPDEQLMMLMDKGKKDARAWAQREGYMNVQPTELLANVDAQQRTGSV